MWTKRFVALPIEVFNTKEQELTGKAQTVPVFLSVNPFDITAYRTTFDESGEGRTYIELRNGSGYMITMSVQEFEETMNLFTQTTN